MAARSQNNKNIRPIVGWREWLALPDLGVNRIKAKIDSGAKTSALHAFQIEEFIRARRVWVRFHIQPEQRNMHHPIRAEAPLIEMRKVKDSGGKVTIRHVIETTMLLGKIEKKIELTLTNRDEMGFRMLLGRQAAQKSFLIDPSKSFLLSKVKKKTKKSIKTKSKRKKSRSK